MIGVAIIMAILAIQLLDSKNKTFQYTVYVHGKGGKTDKVLRGEGFVRLYLNSDPKKQKIDEDGRAVFTEISPTFLGKSIRIDIEHPQPYQTIHPDSLFILTDNGVVDLAIALQGTNKLIGKVMDEATNDFLDSVRVSVFNIETFTDKNGYFELTIPEAKQEKFQKVFFEKKGYELYLQDSVPLHTHQQMIVGMKRKSK